LIICTIYDIIQYKQNANRERTGDSMKPLLFLVSIMIASPICVAPGTSAAKKIQHFDSQTTYRSSASATAAKNIIQTRAGSIRLNKNNTQKNTDKENKEKRPASRLGTPYRRTS
jgi:hypothetical protein